MSNIVVKSCAYGKGVFATSEILAGEVILIFSGPLVDRKGLPNPYSAENDYYLQIGEDLFLGPSGDIDDYVNHSCTPNTGVIITGIVVRLEAIRTIRKGEEICFDYSTTQDKCNWEMECSCGSLACRKKIGDFLILPVDLQEQYVRLGIVPDYIIRKHLD